MGPLGWILTGLGGLLALLLVALVLLLVVPVQLDAVWRRERRAFALAGPGLRLGYDLGDGTLEVRLFGRSLRRWRPRQRGSEKEEAPEGERKPRRRRRGRGLSLRKLVAQRRAALRAVAAFFRRLRWRRLRIDAVVASPDPALTGWLCAAAYGSRGALPPRWRAGVGLRADFGAEAPAVEAEASLRLQPLQVAWLGLRLWWLVRRARVPRTTAASARSTPAHEPAG